ncbi:hypothetical protein [Leeuwenhoekiella parthenopeia]|uniref:Apea-like HEPN domain-containing protein n=1 Tax=Leeuwenhoekiella parthenopeia TaxID=2890320 RepID=A0ABS8GSI1_9FLAO|nr:hypothetical protein [Leeuwenhoekiella parthenopeia]MCC4212960.1 hypothetical protein [Leeuwenhoekiella parthenopeia]
MAKKNYGKSLALQHFYKSIEAEIRNYWQINTSLIYSERWWKTIPEIDLPARITLYPGDNKIPFTSIDLPPKTYLENHNSVLQITRENSIVNFITVFEVYLFNIVKRMMYLQPTLIGESGMPFEAKEIADEMENDNVREWFAEKVTQKYIRNKSHLMMVKRLESMLKYQLNDPSDGLVEDWNKWTYVRNAIIHNGRETSDDLSRVWNERFTSVGAPLNMTDADIIKLPYIAIELAKKVDKIIMESVIQNEDAGLLVRELFVRNGIEESQDLAKSVWNILNSRLGKPLVQKYLAYQKRTGAKINGWRFTHYNFME